MSRRRASSTPGAKKALWPFYKDSVKSVSHARLLKRSSQQGKRVRSEEPDNLWRLSTKRHRFGIKKDGFTLPRVRFKPYAWPQMTSWVRSTWGYGEFFPTLSREDALPSSAFIA